MIFVLNINKCYFCSVFKKETGSTFINYLNNYKIEKSKELLKNPNISLLDVSLSVGYNNQSYFDPTFALNIIDKRVENYFPVILSPNLK